MKRFVSFVLAIVMILTCIALVSCSKKLDGTYVSFDSVLRSEVTFKGDRVSLSAFGVSISGTYVIEKDTLTITGNVLGIDISNSYSFRMSGKSIFIDGVEFVKN